MRTVRKVARARNRPRRGLAWLIVLALILLMLVASRAAAEPTAEDAIRYANAGLDGDDDDCEHDDDGDDDRGDPCDPRACHEAVTDWDASDRAAHEPPTTSDRDAHDGCPVVDRDASGGGPADERGASEEGARDEHGDERWAGDVAVDELDAEAMALLESAELDEDAIRTGVAFTSATFDDAAALRDLGERHHRPSRWGRVDLTVAWRRTWSVAAMHERADALWLYATWRR